MPVCIGAAELGSYFCAKYSPIYRPDMMFEHGQIKAGKMKELFYLLICQQRFYIWAGLHLGGNLNKMRLSIA
jgi:hypothetical protein